MERFYQKKGRNPTSWGSHAERQNRTDDTAIFSRVLYQLSYLGLSFAILTFSRVVVKKRDKFDIPHSERYNESENINYMEPKVYTIIGLTGNIGSGKSMVLQMLRHMGAYGIDADEVTRKAHQQAETAAAIRRQFGNLDRKALAQVVFKDVKALADLESIIHPAVTRIVQALIETASLPVIVIEAIKLLESDLVRMCDSIWVVDADNTTVIERLQKQRGMDEQAISARLANQSPIMEKKKRADVVIENDAGRERTWRQIQQAWNELINEQSKTSVKKTGKKLFAPLEKHIVKPFSSEHDRMRSMLDTRRETKWVPNQREITPLELDAWICDRIVMQTPLNKESRAYFGWKMSTFTGSIDAINDFRGGAQHIPMQFDPELADALGQTFRVEKISLPVPEMLPEEYEKTLEEAGFKPETEATCTSAQWRKAGYNVINKQFWNIDAYLKGK